MTVQRGGWEVGVESGGCGCLRGGAVGVSGPEAPHRGKVLGREGCVVCVLWMAGTAARSHWSSG